MGNIISWISDCNTVKGPIIKTKYGLICGKTFTFYDGKKVSAFLGVPFAKCGTYNERFQDPLPPDLWGNVKDCTRFGPRSIQNDMIWDRFLTPVSQDERNCLNMAIFAPNWKSEQFPNGLPVMVFVHGGGYLIHSAANYGDFNICSVIVCSIQYRLGLLGFLSTGDNRSKGNFGLKDQVAAFQWIRENISLFGGDPNNITAFGQSAGAASIDFISISPQFNNSFDRLILMGGNASGDWALNTPKNTLKAAEKIAKKYGFKGSYLDVDDLLNFLKTQSPNNITQNLIGKSAFNLIKNGLDFCPVLDKDFLPEVPSNLRKKAQKYCVIIGATDFEALLFHALGRSQSNIASIKKFLSIYISEECKNYNELREEAMKIYLPNSSSYENAKEISKAFMRMYSDILMNNATQKYCEEMVVAGHDVYRYNFTYYNPDSFGFFSYRMPFLAATHCHDLRYLFGKGLYAKFRPNCDDIQMLNTVTTLWTNFAKYGNPNGDSNSDSYNEIWKKLTFNDLYAYLEIDLELKMKTNYQGRRYDFWKKVSSNKIQ